MPVASQPRWTSKSSPHTSSKRASRSPLRPDFQQMMALQCGPLGHSGAANVVTLQRTAEYSVARAALIILSMVTPQSLPRIARSGSGSVDPSPTSRTKIPPTFADALEGLGVAAPLAPRGILPRSVSGVRARANEKLRGHVANPMLDRLLPCIAGLPHFHCESGNTLTGQSS
jgi:hypothetical protein